MDDARSGSGTFGRQSFSHIPSSASALWLFTENGESVHLSLLDVREAVCPTFGFIFGVREEHTCVNVCLCYGTRLQDVWLLPLKLKYSRVFTTDVGASISQ